MLDSNVFLILKNTLALELVEKVHVSLYILCVYVCMYSMYVYHMYGCIASVDIWDIVHAPGDVPQ